MKALFYLAVGLLYMAPGFAKGFEATYEYSTSIFTNSPEEEKIEFHLESIL